MPACAAFYQDGGSVANLRQGLSLSGRKRSLRLYEVKNRVGVLLSFRGMGFTVNTRSSLNTTVFLQLYVMQPVNSLSPNGFVNSRTARMKSHAYLIRKF